MQSSLWLIRTLAGALKAADYKKNWVSSAEKQSTSRLGWSDTAKKLVVCVAKVICVHVCGYGQVQRLYGEQPHARKQHLGGKDIKKKGTEIVPVVWSLFGLWFLKKLQHQKNIPFNPLTWFQWLLCSKMLNCPKNWIQMSILFYFFLIIILTISGPLKFYLWP